MNVLDISNNSNVLDISNPGSYILGIPVFGDTINDGDVISFNESEERFEFSPAASSLQTAFDGGQSITIADGDDQTLTITNNDVTNSPTAVAITNATSNYALEVVQTGVLGVNKSALRVDWQADNTSSASSALHVYSNIAHTSSIDGRALVRVVNDNAASVAQLSYLQQDGDNEAMYVDNNGNSRAMVLDHDDTGTQPTLDVDRDGNSASNIWAVRITTDNAGAGRPGGIDFSGMAIDEPLFKATSDAITTAGTVSRQIPVDIGGTIYYLVAYTHGS